jgi:AraC-like DNA-binding protein
VHFSAALIRAILARGVSRGLDPDALLRAGGIDRSALDDPGGRIPFEAAAPMIEEALRSTGMPDLGLRAGAGLSTGALHVLGPLVEGASTLREALGLLDRYAPLVFDGARYELVEAGGLAALRFHHPPVAPPIERFLEDFTFAFAYRVGQGLMIERPLRLDVVRLRYPRPADATLHARLFECEVEFGASECEAVADAALLDLPLLRKDPRLASLLQRRAEELLAEITDEVPFEARVRAILAEQPALTHAVLEETASRLGVGRRTLQRRLGEAGTSWTRLLEDEQRRRACAALARSPMAIKEVADHVGFAEPSNFYRAFKRWTGLTPAEYRRHHRG